jgi:succinate-acetate transporter protein
MATTAESRDTRFTKADDVRRIDVANRTRFVVMPVAPPSILGLFGFSGATFIVAAHLAGWYGDASSPTYLFPFAAALGGIAQFAAGLWGFRARDGVATAMHCTWGSFWLAFGLLHLLAAVGAFTLPSGEFPELAFWFFALAAITAAGAVASLVERNLGLVGVLAPLATGAAFLAIHYLTGGSTWQEVGGWVLLAASWMAFYAAFAMLLEASSGGRIVLPLMKIGVDPNVPGRRVAEPIGWGHGEPGVKQGQ